MLTHAARRSSTSVRARTVASASAPIVVRTRTTSADELTISLVLCGGLWYLALVLAIDFGVVVLLTGNALFSHDQDREKGRHDSRCECHDTAAPAAPGRAVPPGVSGGRAGRRCTGRRQRAGSDHEEARRTARASADADPGAQRKRAAPGGGAAAQGGPRGHRGNRPPRARLDQAGRKAVHHPGRRSSRRRPPPIAPSPLRAPFRVLH